MTITIALKPEMENQLVEQALEIGLPIEVYVQKILEQSIQKYPAATNQTKDGWEALLESTFISYPPLSNEVMSRENMYEDR